MSVVQAARVIRPVPPTAPVLGGLGEAIAEIRSPLKGQPDRPVPRTGSGSGRGQTEAGKVVGQRAEVRTPDAHRRSTQEVVSGLQIGFLMCAAGAMIVGLFLVYNAMAVTVAERRPDIGILRSVGATRGQIIVLFATAAAVLGVIGAVLGVPLGIRLAEVTLTSVPERTGVDVSEPGHQPDADVVDERGPRGAGGRVHRRVRGACAGGAGRQRRPGPRGPPQPRRGEGRLEARPPPDVSGAGRRRWSDDPVPARTARAARGGRRDDLGARRAVALGPDLRRAARLARPAARPRHLPNLRAARVRQPAPGTGSHRCGHRGTRGRRRADVPDGGCGPQQRGTGRHLDSAGGAGGPFRLQREHDDREQLELADGRVGGPRHCVPCPAWIAS